MDKELRSKLIQKEKALKQFEKELTAREKLIEIVEKYLHERAEELKARLLEHGMTITNDEDAVFLME